MLEIGERIHSDMSGKTYVVTWASETITMAEVGFAKTDYEGEIYFIKRLLNMKYPLDSAPGSPAMKAFRREACENHFKKYKELYVRIQHGCGDGACVPIIDYFREGAFYYTVYKKINASSLSLSEISLLSERDKYKLLLRLVQGLMPMHSLGVIHGDLKPENILVQSASDDWKIRLIDMNDCYQSGDPNSPGNVVGTPDYYSPELLKYNTYEFEDEEDSAEISLVKKMAKDLTVKSDIFALGIIFSEFFCGMRPQVKKEGIKYIHEAVIDGGITLNDSIPEILKSLIFDMLNSDYQKRPSLKEVGDRLKMSMIEGGRILKPTISFVDKGDGFILTTINSDNSCPIYYTTDGSDPEIKSQKYTEPFSVKKYTLVKAVCIDGKRKSETESISAWVKTGGIKVKSKAPKILVNGRNVRIVKDPNSPETTKIYYTTDSSKPTTRSLEYKGEFTVNRTVNLIRAIAVEQGFGRMVSDVSESKVYAEKLKGPVIHYKLGKVSMSSEEGMPIYYTLDGSDPNKDSQLYISPFCLPDVNKFIVKAAVFDETNNILSEISTIQRPNTNILKK